MKDMYKGVKAFQVSPVDPDPYNRLRKEYDNYFGEVRRERDGWRSVAFICIVMAAASNLGWLYAASLPKAVPHVIEIAPWGEAKYVGNIGDTGQKINIPEKAKIYALRKVIEQIRSIPVDRAVFTNNLEEAYQLLPSKTAAIITKELKDEDVFKLFGTVRREVQIQSVINVTGNAWQIDWIEVVYDISSANVLEKRRMRAIITIAQGEPGQSVKTANPLGIYLDSYQRQMLEG